MRLLTAKYVLPVSSPPIVNGGVAIDGEIIAAVAPSDELSKQYPHALLTDMGNAAIIPGLVNCHSHLEITAMRGALDEYEHDFAAWLLQLNEIRSTMSDDEIMSAAVLGAREGARAGVTCFGDIGRKGRVGLDALRTVGLRGVLFQETEFSPDNRTANKDFVELGARFEALKADETDLVQVGLSPHSPYTVGSQLFELIAQYAIINRIPLSIHAAESLDEINLLRSGTGLFAAFFERADIEWSSPHSTPIEYLERLGVLATRPLLGHCVQVSPTDIERIAANHAKIAHCPKSNAKFGHGAAPLEAFLDAGITVGLGSDSVASNNICDIIEESRFAVLTARNRADSARFISPREALEMATIGGAAALGLEDRIGTLAAGKFADLAVISLDGLAQSPVNDVHAAIVFSSNAGDVAMTMVAGKEITA